MLSRLVDRVLDMFSPRRTAIVQTPRVLTKEEHGIDPKLVSWEAKRTCELLQRKGYQAYIVGGAVRDLLLGVTPKDFDVATNATPEQVKRCQKRAIIIGRRFKLVHVIFGQEIIECSTFRALEGAGQRKDSNGRVLSDNVFGEMWEDAARRDFTVNALYYDPKTQEVFDYHHGFEDLQAKRLCMIGDPCTRYREDPVRMVRAVRIAAKLGFTMEPATERPIPSMGHLLNNVPSARLVDEFLKLLTSGHAVACLRKLRSEGLHRELVPMLDSILSEEGAEDFLMLALGRTDERIAQNKPIAPFFLYATLLWPQVRRRWQYNQTRKAMKPLPALHSAASEVLETQSAELNITRHMRADIYDVWVLQGRFERRVGKSARSLLAHPRYRAGYDFLVLRADSGQASSELAQWWKHFAEALPEERDDMIAQQQRAARETADEARRGRHRTEADKREDELESMPTLDSLEFEATSFDRDSEVPTRKPSRPRRRGSAHRSKGQRRSNAKARQMV